MSSADATDQVIERELARLARGLEAVRQPGRSGAQAMDRAAYLLLDNLADHPRSVRALADDLHLDHSTVTRQVAALLDRDLARRVADPAGGRAAVLELTQQGRRQLSAERTSRAERVGITLRSWSDTDRDDLARLLVQLNSSIDARLRNPAGT